MSKEAFYFSHDCNAKNDEKILSLRMDFGWEGYGIYWALVEMLRESTAFELQTDYKRIAFALNVKEEVIEKIINNYGLFNVENQIFWSDSLKNRMLIKEAKSDKARKAALKRWGKINDYKVVDNQQVNANALQAQSKGNAIKEKKRKEIYTETGFLEDWAKVRKAIDGYDTNIKRLEIFERQNFNRLIKEFTQLEFREAIQGLFQQQGMIPTTRVRPKHFLNERNIEKYLDAFKNKKQLYKKSNAL